MDSLKTTGSQSGAASDEELVRRFQRDPDGNAGRAAATGLFERYQERVYLWCYRRVRNHETALDLAQDVLLSAYRGLPAYEGRCPYAAWVFTIARNRCFKSVRARGLVFDEAVEAADLPGSQKGPDIRLEEKEDEEALLKMIRKILNSQEQLAIWLRCVESLPVEEITRRLEIHGASGARGTLQNARRKLRSALGRSQLRRTEGPE